MRGFNFLSRTRVRFGLFEDMIPRNDEHCEFCQDCWDQSILWAFIVG